MMSGLCCDAPVLVSAAADAVVGDLWPCGRRQKRWVMSPKPPA